jgi:hypothetical protein
MMGWQVVHKHDEPASVSSQIRVRIRIRNEILAVSGSLNENLSWIPIHHGTHMFEIFTSGLFMKRTQLETSLLPLIGFKYNVEFSEIDEEFSHSAWKIKKDVSDFILDPFICFMLFFSL